ncbi:hypothetical protein [Sulfuriroseicoccus oceanibius]|uniref:Uncharacterized protein n=1 Tax=Sulfuriroseicoccus oceanibius TaxID=2707525 RepID=A0A7T7F2J2_9BACT|nr:hypothetical protein [Sulfuriroseicoccus oceanibius]QQL45380.1 hypothetical protein G3M56_001960 [Sulfuriroseicoccus oceanibius]
MTRLNLPLIASALCLMVLASCQSPKTLRPFTTDGCSMFPDRSPDGKYDWKDCCLIHDVAYWQGGTRKQREAADQALHDDVLAATGDAALAATMFRGVRLGGSPYFPTGYRWGYGWSYRRGYKPLNLWEKAQVKARLHDYLEDRPDKRKVLEPANPQLFAE